MNMGVFASALVRRLLLGRVLVAGAMMAAIVPGTAIAPGSAAAQDVMLASRAPRFLYASSGRAAPVEINAASSATLRRVVSLNVERPTVGRLLAAIEQQTGLRFGYSRDVLQTDRLVALRADTITVGAALLSILMDAGVDVLLSSGQQVSLVEKVRTEQSIAAGAIVGRVTDGKTKAALGGATVVLEGTSRSATTGNDGRYRIADVAPGTYTIRARYIGYAPASTSATVSSDQEATADLALEKSAQRLEQVVVTGTETATPERELPNPISVITSEQIHEQHVQRIDELFRGDIPGIFAWDQGASSYYNTINVRGASSLSGGTANPKVYIDGVEVKSPTYIATLDPNSVERIEVIRGPQASTIYGSDALNGVLQVFTKAGGFDTKPHLDAQASGGVLQTRWATTSAVDQQDYSASLSGGGPQFSYSAGGAHAHTGEWIKEYFNTGNSLYASAKGTTGAFTAQLSGRYSHYSQAFPLLPFETPFAGAPFNLAPVNSDLLVGNTTFGATLGYHVNPRWVHTLTLGYDRLLTETTTRPRLTTPADTLFNVGTAQGSKASVRYNTTLALAIGDALAATITMGADYYQLRNDFVDLTAQSPTGSFGGQSFIFGSRTDFHNAGYFAQVHLAIEEHLFATVGLRAEDNANFGHDFGLAWAPRAGLAYVTNTGNLTVKARGSYGKAIRPPDQGAGAGSVSADQIFLPNPELGPETQLGWDAGVEVDYGSALSIQATYYHQKAEGLIDAVLVDGSSIPPTYQFQNIGRVNNRGWEIEASASPLSRLSISGTYSIATSEVAAVSPTYTGDLRVGDQLLGIPRHTAGVAVSYRLGRATARLGMTHVGTWTGIDWNAYFPAILGAQPFLGSGRSYWITYPAFEKYRLNVAYDLTRRVTAFVSVNNLTNSGAYEQDNSFLPPGRAIMAGLHVGL